MHKVSRVQGSITCLPAGAIAVRILKDRRPARQIALTMIYRERFFTLRVE